MRLHFAEFCFDTDRRELSKEGTEIHLTPKAMDLLALLLAERPRVLPKSAIYDGIWPGTFVEESNLSVVVSELRAALGDDPRRPRFVKTRHGFGYGFMADVRAVRDAAVLTPVRLLHGRDEYVLLEGENLIGRDAGALVRLNHPGISRLHARIVVDGGEATIEDLGSKNGTFVKGERVDRALRLEDGDEIRISRELLVVLKSNQPASTVSEAGQSW